VFLLQSCIVVPPLGSRYKYLSEDSKNSIVYLNPEDDICYLENNDKIFAITSEQLYKCIKEKEKSMVYFWTIHCKSEYCYPLSFVQSYCDSRNINLYVIITYYDDTYLRIGQKTTSSPIFSINEKFYKKKIQWNNTHLFIKELIKDKVVTDEILYSGVYIFNYGNLLSYSYKIVDANEEEF